MVDEMQAQGTKTSLHDMYPIDSQGLEVLALAAGLLLHSWPGHNDTVAPDW